MSTTSEPEEWRQSNGVAGRPWFRHWSPLCWGLVLAYVAHVCMVVLGLGMAVVGPRTPLLVTALYAFGGGLLNTAAFVACLVAPFDDARKRVRLSVGCALTVALLTYSLFEGIL